MITVQIRAENFLFFWDVRWVLLREPCFKSLETGPWASNEHKKRKNKNMFQEFKWAQLSKQCQGALIYCIVKRRGNIGFTQFDALKRHLIITFSRLLVSISATFIFGLITQRHRITTAEKEMYHLVYPSYKKLQKRKPVIASHMKNSNSASCAVYSADKCKNRVGKLRDPPWILLTVFNISDSDAQSLPLRLTL